MIFLADPEESDFDPNTWTITMTVQVGRETKVVTGTITGFEKPLSQAVSDSFTLEMAVKAVEIGVAMAEAAAQRGPIDVPPTFPDEDL